MTAHLGQLDETDGNVDFARRCQAPPRGTRRQAVQDNGSRPAHQGCGGWRRTWLLQAFPALLHACEDDQMPSPALGRFPPLVLACHIENLALYVYNAGNAACVEGYINYAKLRFDEASDLPS